STQCHRRSLRRRPHKGSRRHRISPRGCAQFSRRRLLRGGDVRAFAAADEPSAFVGGLATSLHRAIRTLTRSSAVVIAAVRGWATGAGMSLALAADICVAAETARFRAAYPAIGLSPDGGLSW